MKRLTGFTPPRFTRVAIRGFRRLADVDCPLRPLNVMIGANGIGKSSLLDAFDLLSESAQGRLNHAVSNHGGVNSILTVDHGEALSLSVDMDTRPELKYRVVLHPRGAGYEIEEESLTQQRAGKPEPFIHIQAAKTNIRYFEPAAKKLIRPTWDHNPLETSLSQVPKLFQESESFRKRLASSTYYHVLDVGPQSPVRLPQPMRPADLPGKNGEDLVSCLYSLREGDRDRFEVICDTLSAAFPSFERLDFPPVAAGTLALTWREKGFSRPLYMHQLSEGTLRFLWLVTLLQSPGLTTVTLLDEPEVSLHPELLRLLADLFREASRRTQLIIATHSDRLIRFLHPKEVIVMDAAENGLTQLTWADSLNLEAWLAEYSLDELWQKGRLGGRA